LLFPALQFLLHSNSLTDIRISLVDNYGREVNLNGIPFIITIKVDIIEPEDAGMKKPIGRGAEMPDQSKTNLQLFNENPRLINTNIPAKHGVNLQDYIEYNLINEMLDKVRRKKKSKKA
jgi:hypothetical protein